MPIDFPLHEEDYPPEDVFGDTGQWNHFVAGTSRVLPENSVAALMHVSKDAPPLAPMINNEEVTPVKWDWRIVLAWVVFAIYGIVLEFFTLLDGNESTPPLTWVVIRYVPEVIGIGFVSWLLYHFTTEYWKVSESDGSGGGNGA